MKTSPVSRFRPVLAGGLALLMLAVLFSSPAMQVAAKDFLDLFRVKHFTAIAFDRDRLERLQSGRIDMEAMLGDDDIEVLKEAQPLGPFKTLDEAAQATGLPLRTPTWLPDDLSNTPMINASDSHTTRFTVNSELLTAALEMLEITDVKVPEKLNGSKVTLGIPTTVEANYYSDQTSVWNHVSVIQARTPVVELPEGVSMADLGVIGLRIAGMSPDEAQKFAQTIDWNSTLIIPVPTDVATFSETTVHGADALLLVSNYNVVLLWAEGDMLYAVNALDSETAMQVAESLR